MNEEEKKIIKKFVEKCNKFDESVEIKGVSVGEEYRILETVCKALDLVEKLQKENELAKKQVEYDKTHIYTPQTIKLNYISIQKVKDKIEELKQYKLNLLKEDYAKKQKEFKSQNVLVCNAIRDIAATGKIDILKEIIGDK